MPSESEPCVTSWSAIQRMCEPPSHVKPTRMQLTGNILGNLMKHLFALALLVLFAAQAEQNTTIVLHDGEKVSLLRQDGFATSYIHQAELVDGRVHNSFGSVFNGTQLVRRTNGQCLTVVSKLVSVEKFSSAAGVIELPTVSIQTRASACGAI